MARSRGNLVRRALRGGLIGGHRGWQAVLLVVALARVVQRVARPGPGPVVHRQRLRAGEGIEIRHLPASAFHGSEPSGQ